MTGEVDEFLWTGHMILTALRRFMTQSVFDLMVPRFIPLIDDSDRPKYIKTRDIIILLHQRPVHVTNLEEFIKELLYVRQLMGSAEYFQLQNGVLDPFRDFMFLEHSEPNAMYMSVREKLHCFANSGYRFLMKNEANCELVRMALFYEMEKLAHQYPAFEVVDDDFPCLDLNKLDRLEYEVNTDVQEFMRAIKTTGCKNMKQQFVEQVFGKLDNERHYLVDYFERIYDVSFGPYEAEMSRKKKDEVDLMPFFGLIQAIYKAQKFVEKFKNSFFLGSSFSSDISYMKNNGKKPILRSIRHGPSVDDKYLFTVEVALVSNFVNKIKGKRDAFSVHGDMVKFNASDGAYLMINFEDLDEFLEVGKLSRVDLKIVDTFSKTSSSLELIQSPKNTLSVFAGTAIIEIFKIMSRETDQFLNLGAQHFDKLKTFFKSLEDAFDSSKDEIYTLKYDMYLEKVKNGTDMLRPLLSRKMPLQPLELKKVMRKKEIWSRIDKTYQFSKKFIYFKHLFHKFYEGVKMIKLGEVMDRLPELLLCAFFGEFPDYAAFVHRQKACFILSRCALKYVPLTMDMDVISAFGPFAKCRFHPPNAPKLSESVVAPKVEKVEKEEKEEEVTVQNPLTGFKRGFLNSPSKRKMELNSAGTNGKLVEAAEKPPTYDELARILKETEQNLEYEKTQRIENMNKFREDSDAHLNEIRELVSRNVTMEQEKMNAIEMMKNYVSVIEKKKNNDNLMEQKMAQVVQKSENLEKSHSELQKYYETCSKKLGKAEKEQKLVKAEFERKLEQEKEKGNVDLRKAENEADSLRETIKKLELEQKKMLTAKKTNFLRAEELKVELASAQKENGRLQANIERSTNKSTKLEAGVAQLRQENGKLRGNMERTENICERLRQEFYDGLDTITDLEANLQTAESALESAKNDGNSLLKDMGEYLKLVDENDFIEAAKLQLELFVESSEENLDREEYEMALWKFDKFSDSVKSFHEIVSENIVILAKYPNLERSQLKQLPQFPEPFTLKTMAKMEKKIRGETPVSVNHRAERKEEEGPVCGICFKVMEYQQNLLACRVCQNEVHRECFLKWENINATCLYCCSLMGDDVAFPALT